MRLSLWMLLLGAVIAPAVAAFAEDVLAALADARISIKAAAIAMEIDASQFRRQLLDGHLTIARLAALSSEFHQYFAVRRAKRLGIPDELIVGRQLERATLKMGLPRASQQERAS